MKYSKLTYEFALFNSQAYKSIDSSNGGLLVDNILPSKSKLHYKITMRGDVIKVFQTGATKKSFSVKGPVYNLKKYTKSKVSFEVDIASMLLLLIKISLIRIWKWTNNFSSLISSNKTGFEGTLVLDMAEFSSGGSGFSMSFWKSGFSMSFRWILQFHKKYFETIHLLMMALKKHYDWMYFEMNLFE